MWPKFYFNLRAVAHFLNARDNSGKRNRFILDVGKEHRWATREVRLMGALMLITFQDKPVRLGPCRQIPHLLTSVVQKACSQVMKDGEDTT